MVRSFIFFCKVRMAVSHLATTKSPLVSLSNLCTIQGRSVPFITESDPKIYNKAFTSVPLFHPSPGTGCTFMPAFLFITAKSSFSNTISTGTFSASTDNFSVTNSTSTTSLCFTSVCLFAVFPFSVTRPSSHSFAK